MLYNLSKIIVFNNRIVYIYESDEDKLPACGIVCMYSRVVSMICVPHECRSSNCVTLTEGGAITTYMTLPAGYLRSKRSIDSTIV